MYIHFKDECLKLYDSTNYYAPNESFKYDQIKISKKTKDTLSLVDIDYLANLGVI